MGIYGKRSTANGHRTTITIVSILMTTVLVTMNACYASPLLRNNLRKRSTTEHTPFPIRTHKLIERSLYSTAFDNETPKELLPSIYSDTSPDSSDEEMIEEYKIKDGDERVDASEAHSMVKKALSLFAHWKPPYSTHDDTNLGASDIVSAVSRGVNSRQKMPKMRWG